MKKNNSSEKKRQPTGKEVNDSSNSGLHNKGKGTGMSSEAGSEQTEESWQGTGGGNASDAQRKAMNSGNDNEIPKGSASMSNSGMSNQWKGSNPDLDTDDVEQSSKKTVSNFK